MKYLKISALVFSVFALASCRYDKADELYATPACDTTVSTTFSQYVSVVVQDNCLSCHSYADSHALGGDIILADYTNIIDYVNTGQFMGAITHDPNYVAMPQDAPKLDPCTILKLQKWINNGAQDN